MTKNRFFPFTLLSILFLSACGGFSDSVVKPAEIIRGTTNNETLNGYRSFELGEAILLFMPDKNTESVGWDFRSDAPIIWLTEGYKSMKGAGNNEWFSRKGLIRINVQGIESKVLRQKKDELPWVVEYLANKTPKFGIESISFLIGGSETPKNVDDYCFGSLHENCAFDPEPSLKANNIAVVKVCQNNLIGTHTVGYELSSTNKKNTLAVLEYSSGSGGESSSFKLAFSKDKKDLCKDEEESSATDSKPVETITPTEKEPTSPEEQTSLGVRYELTDHNLEKASYWYKKAAEQGYAKAQYYLAGGYREGNLFAKDEEKAVFWYKKSAEQGFVDAQNALGMMYEFGKGINQDTKKAIYWYGKAAKQGNESAKKALTRIKEVPKTAIKTDKETSAEIVAQIISRCKKDMGQYGAAMVKGCVDQDVKAVADILPLLKTYPVASQRCLNDMGQYGYTMVRGCITQDINAEEALKRY